MLVLLETEVSLGVLLRGWGVSPALLNKGSIRARILGRGERFSFLAGNCFHYRAWRQQKKRHLRAREPARVAPDLPFKAHWTRHRNLVLFLGMHFRGSKAHFEEHALLTLNSRCAAGGAGRGRERALYLSAEEHTAPGVHAAAKRGL